QIKPMHGIAFRESFLTGFAKQLFGFLKEALAERIFFSAAKLREFLELVFLRGREMSWDFDVDSDVEVAVAIALDIPNAVTFEAEHGARLGAGRNFDDCFSVHGRNLDLRAQGGLNKTYGDFAKQVVAVALEEFVWANVQNDVEVAGWAAAKASCAVARGAQA